MQRIGYSKIGIQCIKVPLKYNDSRVDNCDPIKKFELRQIMDDTNEILLLGEDVTKKIFSYLPIEQIIQCPSHSWAE